MRDRDRLDVPNAARLFGRSDGSGYTLDALRLALPELSVGTLTPGGGGGDTSLSRNLIRFACCLSPILMTK